MEGVYPQHLFNPSFYENKLFTIIDLKGFTSLCSQYIHEDVYGIEKISNLINNLFNPVIDIVYENEGEVISFSGDAILITVNPNNIENIRKNANDLIRRMNKRKKLNIGIHFDVLEKRYYPHTLKTQPFFLYYPKKSDVRKTIINIPNKIKEIYSSRFKGELRVVPVSFIHIKKDTGYKAVISLIEQSIKNSEGIYINKIEFLDKGWMILLSAGLPIYTNHAPEKLYNFLHSVIQKAKRHNIPISSSITLQKEYCGIVGNEKRWEYTFLGNGVNQAARMAVKGETYSIICDNEFRINNKERFLFVERDEEYKGIGKVSVFTISKKLKTKRKELFIGREKETEKIISFLSSPLNFIMVYGPSGIGKTYLIKYALKNIKAKVITLRGDSNLSSPLYLFENSPFHKNENISYKEIQKIFQSIKENTIIFIDDIQFADSRSKEVLKWMLGNGNEYVNFISAGFSDKILREITPPISSYNIHKIRLEGFNEREIKTAVKHKMRFDISEETIKKIIKISKGNPLFIRYIIDSIESNKETTIPYSIEEIIFSKIEKLPHGGTRFINDASVYGDSFNKLIIGEIEQLSHEQINKIEDQSCEEGLTERERITNYLRFQNNIIRETVFSSILKKEINYIRDLIGEALLEGKGPNPKSAELFYLSSNPKFLDVAQTLIEGYIKKENYHSARDYLIKTFKFIKSKKLFKQSLPFLKHLISIPPIYLNNTIANLSQDIIVKIDNFNNEEKIILYVGDLLFGIYLKYEAVIPLLEKYKELKGEDYRYIWKRILWSQYSKDREKDSVEKLNNLLNIIKEREDRIEFLMDYTATMFYIYGIKEYVNKGIDLLEEMEPYMTKKQKNAYYRLLSSIYLHLDNIEKSLYYIENTPLKKNRMFYLSNANDLAIIYFHLGIKKQDKRLIDRSLMYANKAYRFVKDELIYSLMPLTTTNLGSSYIVKGDIKKGISLYYEGLKYGEYIKHPVEVPYTKSRIALLSYSLGAKDLAFSIAEEILNLKFKVDDLIPMSLLLTYLKTDEWKYFDESIKMGTHFAKEGMPKCLWEISKLLLDSVILYQRKENLELLHYYLPKWHEDYKTRYYAEMINEINILLIKYIKRRNKSILNKLTQYTNILEELQIGKKTLSTIYLYTAKNLEDIKKSHKYALQHLCYPLAVRSSCTLKSSSPYYRKRCSIETEKIKEISKIKTIKSFVEYFNEKDKIT